MNLDSLRQHIISNLPQEMGHLLPPVTPAPAAQPTQPFDWTPYRQMAAAQQNKPVLTEEAQALINWLINQGGQRGNTTP